MVEPDKAAAVAEEARRQSLHKVREFIDAVDEQCTWIDEDGDPVEQSISMCGPLRLMLPDVRVALEVAEMDGDAREAEGYDRGLAWGVSCAEAEARWQWELDRRRVTGAQVVAQRAQVIAGTIRQAISGDNATALTRPRRCLAGYADLGCNCDGSPLAIGGAMPTSCAHDHSEWLERIGMDAKAVDRG